MVSTKERTITIKEPRMVALAWWRSLQTPFKKGLMNSPFNESRLINIHREPSIVIERIFFKWLDADRSKYLEKENK